MKHSRKIVPQAQTKTGSDTETYLSVQEAALWLGVSPHAGYVNRLIRDEVLPATKHGSKCYRIKMSDLEKFKYGISKSSDTRALKPDKVKHLKSNGDETKKLTVEQTAQHLRVTVERVYQLLATPADKGGLAGTQRGASWEIETQAINEYKQRKRRAGRPATTEGEWVSQSTAAEIYGRLRGRKVSRQAIHDFICKGRLQPKEIDGVRLVSRREVAKLASQILRG